MEIRIFIDPSDILSSKITEFKVKYKKLSFKAQPCSQTLLLTSKDIKISVWNKQKQKRQNDTLLTP